MGLPGPFVAQQSDIYQNLMFWLICAIQRIMTKTIAYYFTISLTLFLLMSSADNFYKQFRPRSGQTKRGA